MRFRFPHTNVTWICLVCTYPLSIHLSRNTYSQFLLHSTAVMMWNKSAGYSRLGNARLFRGSVHFSFIYRSPSCRVYRWVENVQHFRKGISCKIVCCQMRNLTDRENDRIWDIYAETSLSWSPDFSYRMTLFASICTSYCLCTYWFCLMKRFGIIRTVITWSAFHVNISNVKHFCWICSVNVIFGVVIL